MCAEIVITLVFWTVLLPAGDPVAMGFTGWDIFGMCCWHSIPLIFLILDYSLFSCIPFTRRHSLTSYIIGIIYTLMNMTYTLCEHPIYEIMDWRSAKGIIVPLSIFPLVAIFLYGLEILTKWKLKKLG